VETTEENFLSKGIFSSRAWAGSNFALAGIFGEMADTQQSGEAVKEVRDRRKVERLVVTSAPKASKDVELKGTGTPLGEIATIAKGISSLKGDDEVTKHLHQILFKKPGTENNRKKNIRLFNGFDESEVAAKKAKFNEKWKIETLKKLCEVLGLEKSGTKTELVDRVVEFLTSPSGDAVKEAPEPKKKSASSGSKKRKSAGGGEKSTKKAKKEKKEHKPRPTSGYIVFSNSVRDSVQKKNPDMKITEISKEIGVMWAELTDAQKEKHKQAGIDAFKKKYPDAELGTAATKETSAKKPKGEKKGDKKPKAPAKEEDEDEEKEDET